MKRILIVDDDPSYAKMVRAWIKAFYKADIVTAGARAADFLKMNTVDLVLLDYEMPVADGPQVLKMLREQEETKDTPVVFLTGIDSEERMQQVRELNPAGFFLKSSTRDELLAYLKDKLGE